MKFACDRCGKRYASVDEPAAGRVYRIRCRCGHVIVVRGPASAPRGAADVELNRFELPPLPPPLAAPAPENPSGAGEPPRSPDECARSVAPPPSATAAEAPAPARKAAPVAAGDEGPVQDDPFLHVATGAEPYAMGSAGIMKGESWAARSPLDRHEEPGAESGEPLEVGTAALPAAAVRPALSLGLDEDGSSGARRRVFLAAIIALLAAVAALAVSRM